MDTVQFFMKLVVLRKLTSMLSLQCAKSLMLCNDCEIGDPDDLENLVDRGSANLEEMVDLKLPASNKELLSTLAVFLDTAKIATDIFAIVRSESNEYEDLPEVFHTLIAMRHETVAIVQELSVYELE